jgi:primase-polymerase (primpol)-like protein
VRSYAHDSVFRKQGGKPVNAANKHEADAIRLPSGLTQSLRGELKVNHANIPDELKALKAWVLWEITKIDPNTGKFDKVPSYPTGKRRSGEQGSPEDRAQLGTFADAWAAFERNSRYAGIGLAMLPSGGFVAFDADHCIDASGAPPDYLAELVDETYAEISPSHTGIRAFWKGTAANGRNIPKGLELYSQKQFVTVTGRVIDNSNNLGGGGVTALSGALRVAMPAGRKEGNQEPF